MHPQGLWLRKAQTIQNRKSILQIFHHLAVSPLHKKLKGGSAVICLGALIVKIGRKDQPGRLIGNLLRNRRKNLGKLLLPSIVSFFPLYGNIAFLFLRTRLCYVLFRFLFLCKIDFRAGGCVIPHDWEDEGYVFDKIYLGSDENSRPKELFGRMKDMEIIDRGNGFYECVPRGHSKATAIDQVLKHCGISLEDAYVFGDSSNDLSMFRYASNCVLMGHHSPVLEPYASFVTKTVEEDGIAYAMKELG